MTDATSSGSNPDSTTANEAAPCPPHAGIVELERIAAEGWRPLEQAWLGDWLLRASGGFTGRGNSTLVVGEPGLPLPAAVDFVIDWYRRRSLRPTFALPLPNSSQFDQHLGRQGWERFNLTDVKTQRVDALLRLGRGQTANADEYSIDVGTEPDRNWLAAYRYRGQALPAHAVGVITSGEHPIFVTGRTRTGEVAAIGRGAITRRWLGITALEVDERHRRRRLATTVITSLVTYASANGCTAVYLQVADENTAAQALYQHLGFTQHHQYVYRAHS